MGASWRMVAGLCFLLGAAEVRGSKDESSPGELLKQYRRMLSSKRLEEAVEPMLQYVDLVKESRQKRVMELAQDTRYKLATVLMRLQRNFEAAEVLKDYVAAPFAEHRLQAMKMRASALYDAGNYGECVATVTNAFAYDLDMTNVMKKIAYEYGGQDHWHSYYGIKVPEAHLTAADKLALKLVLADSLFKQDRYEECIEHYTYVQDHSEDMQQKGYAIMQIVDSLIKMEEFDRIKVWIPKLYRTEARYDIRVNIALMRAAAALFDTGDYDSALPLYRMILPRDELLAHQRDKLRALRLQAGLPEEEEVALTQDEQLLFGASDGEKDEEKDADGNAAKKPVELLKLEQLIKTLKGLPPYELNVTYRMGDIYKAVERYWESVRFYDLVHSAAETSQEGRLAVYELVKVLLNQLDDRKQAEEKAFAFLKESKTGLTPRLVAYSLTSYYRKKKDLEAIKALKPYLDSFERVTNTLVLVRETTTNEAGVAETTVTTNDFESATLENIRRYDVELYFMQAVADLMLFHFAEAERGFEQVMEDFPDSKKSSEALYWFGIAKLFQQKYAESLPVFEEYLKRFPAGNRVAGANHQAGVCLFGMDQLTNAVERFSSVIEKYPDSSVFSDSCNMRGDIRASWGDTAPAESDYRTAIAHAKRVSQATYGTFQLAALLEAMADANPDREEQYYDAILELIQRYLDDWDNKGADVAKALFWRGKTLIAQEKPDEAVQTYLEAIVKYGGDLKQDGVDLMIDELAKIAAIWLSVEKQEELKGNLKEALAASDNPTLRLRLRVALAKLDHDEVELGKKLLAEHVDLNNAPPPVLAVVCDASFELKDYSRADEILNLFNNKFEDSELVRSAYKLEAFGQFVQKRYDDALKTIKDVQERYGPIRDVAWAQLMKAQILLTQGKIDDAREANRAVLTQAAWRGAPAAQATYQLGEVEEAAGRSLQAFAFYQRTYVQYKGYDGGKWAADAYLSSARCLKKAGPEYAADVRNTYRAMLFDTFVNELPQADVAREALGTAEATQIAELVEAGTQTNITIVVDVPTDNTNVAEVAITGTNVAEGVAAGTNVAEVAVEAEAKGSDEGKTKEDAVDAAASEETVE